MAACWGIGGHQSGIGETMWRFGIHVAIVSPFCVMWQVTLPMWQVLTAADVTYVGATFGGGLALWRTTIGCRAKSSRPPMIICGTRACGRARLRRSPESGRGSGLSPRRVGLGNRPCCRRDVRRHRPLQGDDLVHVHVRVPRPPTAFTRRSLQGDRHEGQQTRDDQRQAAGQRQQSAEQ